MKNNPKLLLYIAAAFLAFVLWQKWQIAHLPPTPAATSTPALETPSVSGGDIPAPTVAGNDIPAPTIGSENASTTTAPQTGAVIHVKTDVFDLDITAVDGTVIRAELPAYPETKNGGKALALLHTENPGRFILQSGLSTTAGSKAPKLGDTFSSTASSYVLTDGQDTLTVPLAWQQDGISVSKIFTFKRGAYDFTIEHKVENHSDKVWQGGSYGRWIFGQPLPSKGLGQVATYTGGVISYDEDPYEKIKLGSTLEKLHTKTGWIAMIQHYFLGAIVPPQGEEQNFSALTHTSGDHVISTASVNAREVAPGGSTSFTSQIYIGPKIQKDLKAVAPNLDKTVDYGFLFMIGQPMFYVINFIHGILHNWGWAIIVTTLLIKLLFFTPSAWAYKSMAKMRRLGPEMQRIKERYGDDRQAASMAMMKLYKDEKVNPASGCLPMLLQIPFFIAFYWVLVESVELRHAPWLGWIQDLSAMDPYYILPIINAALMFLQQKLNPPPPDPTQAKVMMMLPLVFGVMFMWFPSGLVLYWTVSNAFGIVQQYIMNKRYGERQPGHHHHHDKGHKA
ncbi:membrane protein insertase YidC [Cardiobacterium hominis]|uniref:membrane protein insertase YidC n=1 Tax=Cardiobacterium hominis TaxID=2718 RepID=UPI0028F0FF84|nr:membrane protein insertase YidC [Cardiobacterium hominis]